MIKISKGQFVKILENTTEDTIRVRYATDVKMNKKGNPFYVGGELDHDVIKETDCLYGIGGNYTEMVRDAAEDSGVKDSSFNSEGKKWMKTVVKDKVFINTDTETLYLRVRILNDETPDVKYFVDGKPADEDQLDIIDRFERKYSSTVKKQSEYGVDKDKQVRLLSLSFDKIKSVVIDGNEFEIK